MPFPAEINVSELDGSNGFMINGTVLNGYFGWSVSSAGDVNSDGINDVIIGAPGSPNSALDKISGTAYVLFGNFMEFPAIINIQNLNGTSGFTLKSSIESDFAGGSVAKAGDINGDGIDDIILSAIFTNNLDGQAYVVFGGRNGFSPTVDLNFLDGQGFIIGGLTEPAYLGASATGIGDINADGIDDIAIGAHGLNDYTGAAYIIFGSTDAFSANLDVTQLKGNLGFSIAGPAATKAFGVSIRGLGDINGDGIDDLIIGASGGASLSNSFPGAGYIIFGNRNFTLEPPSLSLDGTNGFVLNGVGQGALIGNSVSTAGDINGDGINDIIISAPDAPDETYTGVIYVIFGSRQEFNASLSLANLSGKDGFIISGIDANDRTGWSVSGAGDINCDGLDDIIIGAPWASNQELQGAAYILFGSREPFSAEFNLTALNGVNGFIISGLTQMPTQLGLSVSSAGDINADGVDDIVIGAPGAFNNTGAAYVIFGQAPEPITTCSSTFDLASLNGGNGFIISDVATCADSQLSASSAGDINGDGIGDIIIGASDYNKGMGAAYVVFGSTNNFASPINATQLSITQGFPVYNTKGPIFLGYVVNRAGDVNGDGLVDIMIGAWGEKGTNATILFGSTKSFSAPIEVPSDLSGKGFAFENVDVYDELAFVSGGGDINGDGLDDMVFGVSVANNFAGAAYVILGQSQGFPGIINLAYLEGNKGFIIEGQSSNGRVGSAVSSAGDINGDGLSDIIIGAYEFPNHTEAGAAYVIFGSRMSYSNPFNLALNGTNGFIINGTAPGTSLGISISSDGDINGDGIDDIILGAPGLNVTGALTGGAYVLFGHAGNYSPYVDVTQLNGIDGFSIIGASSESEMGYSVSILGDVNGDGIDDVGLAVPYSREVMPGEIVSYIVFGHRGGFSANVNVSALNGSDGYTIINTDENLVITSISGAGDVNGDRIDDIIINRGQINYTEGQCGLPGNTYVIFGQRCASASSSSTPSFTPSLSATVGVTASLSATTSVSPSSTEYLPTTSGSITPSSSSSPLPLSNTSTPSLMPSRTAQPSFSPSASSENSNSLLPLLIAAPIGAFMLLFLVFGLYVYKKRASQNRYGFFSSEGVEPIPEAGEEIPLQPSGRQMESYSSINNDDESEMLETYENNRKSGSKSYCAVM